jgi:molybdenum cofactor guanylyltransferase
VVLGIFVGGRARRMGGRPKGLLRAPGQHCTIVEALAERFLVACPRGSVCLVGRQACYASLGWPVLEDMPAGVGPLGGLHALLHHAESRPALCVGCDMPYLTTPLFEKLLGHAPAASALAPRRGGRWEPLFARYETAAGLPVAARLIEEGHRSLQQLLNAMAATELPLTSGEYAALRDWDSEADIETD